MSEYDIDVIPPVSGLVQNYAIGPPGGVITIPLVPIGVDSSFWLSFIGDVDWWALFGPTAAAIPDPVPDAVDPAAGQAFRLPANFELQRKISAQYGTLKVAAKRAGILYIQLASHGGGGGY